MQFLVCLLGVHYRRQTHWAVLGSLLYTGFSDQLLSMTEYGDETISRSISIFNRCAIALSIMVTNGVVVERSSWIVAAPFCSSGYINHRRDSTEDTVPADVMQGSSPRKNSFWGTRNYYCLGLIWIPSGLSMWWQESKFLLNKIFRRTQPCLHVSYY